MISYVKGRLADIFGDTIVVEAGSLGFNIRVPLSLLDTLPDIGREVLIYTYFQVKEDAMTLYGFSSRQDLDMFKMLIGVNGVGPKGALAILSVLTPDSLRIALVTGCLLYTSICDSMNYLLEWEELQTVCELVNNYLDPGGIFIFDLNTLYKYRDLLGDSTIAEARDDGSFIWENTFDEEERINEYDLTLFVREEGELFKRYQETHFQRAYTLEEVKRAIAGAGMEFVAAYDAFTRQPPREDSERIYVIARECGKQQMSEK